MHPQVDFALQGEQSVQQKDDWAAADPSPVASASSEKGVSLTVNEAANRRLNFYCSVLAFLQWVTLPKEVLQSHESLIDAGDYVVHCG